MTPPDVEVRPMAPEDIDECVDLFEIVAAERYYIGAEAPIDREDRRARFLRTLESTEDGSLVAVAPGRIVGQIGLKSMRGLIDIGMLVAPDMRGRGIGSALLQAGIDWARSHGAHKMTLQVWPHNQAARELYAKFGFIEEGYLTRQWKRRNGEIWDAVVMGLHL
ncbi:MAG: GNAT family N-acetyltransferase [Actinomycetota bacterium]